MNIIHLISIILAIACVFIIFFIGIKTDLLKESNESGKAYSFSRFQLWLWTLAISPAFVLNWGFYAFDEPNLNITCLILLGIPASITLTGNIITAAHESQREQEAVKVLKSRMEELGPKWAAQKENDEKSIIEWEAQKEKEEKRIRGDIKIKMPLKPDLTGISFWTDILKDDSGQLSIVRLQQLIFTFAYVVIFLSSFFASNMKEYPVFGENAFVLMGISAGTYLIGKGLKK